VTYTFEARLETAARILEGIAERDAPLGTLTTYRVGGSAALFVRANSLGDLERVSEAFAESRLPTLMVGKGSNLLVADAGFPGIAVSLGQHFEQFDLEDPANVRAGGAVSLPVLARQTAAAGITGFEWAVGVPGSIGGAVRMNAGGHGSDMAAVVTSAELIDFQSGVRHTRSIDRLAFGYRRSSVQDTDIVISATLALSRGDTGRAKQEISAIVRWRREHQPGGQNAGSVFTNPEGDSAGRLVEAAGCKGLRIGTAHVSEKHANFIQADDGGSADDVAALIREIQRRVGDDSGVHLEPELQMIGFSRG
jgi:UDP-N-acetylmuramate dehydrogenase